MLLAAPEKTDLADTFVYDPMNPVPTNGGGFCCLGNYKPGAVDQRGIEARNDVLVYSTGPLKEGMEVSGPIDVTLYLSSDARDTDVTVKLIEVLPDGTAYNIDENIQRAMPEDFAWADAVFISGMHIQRNRIHDLTRRAHDAGKVVALGGPSVSSAPDYYPDVDLLHCGEALN